MGCAACASSADEEPAEIAEEPEREIPPRLAERLRRRVHSVGGGGSLVTMDETARNIREPLLSISWDARGAAELLDAHLAAGDVSSAEYITERCEPPSSAYRMRPPCGQVVSSWTTCSG
jgi:hypothetical protein